jgi:antitoxin component YwqK of YwqJK toxin-antitoxin module
VIFEGEYKDGKKSGKFNKYFDDGRNRLISTYNEDQLHGVKKVFDERGQVEESHYVHGVRK